MVNSQMYDRFTNRRIIQNDLLDEDEYLTQLYTTLEMNPTSIKIKYEQFLKEVNLSSRQFHEIIGQEHMEDYDKGFPLDLSADIYKFIFTNKHTRPDLENLYDIKLTSDYVYGFHIGDSFLFICATK